MSKYKFSILFALLFTIPLLGYFTVNGYWWLFDGNRPDPNKMIASLMVGLLAGLANGAIAATESEKK